MCSAHLCQHIVGLPFCPQIPLWPVCWQLAIRLIPQTLYKVASNYNPPKDDRFPPFIEGGHVTDSFHLSVSPTPLSALLSLFFPPW